MDPQAHGSRLIYVFKCQSRARVGGKAKTSRELPVEHTLAGRVCSTPSYTINTLGDKISAEFCAIKSIPDVAEPIIKPSETEEDISGVLGLESESDDDMESLDFNVKLMGELTGELMDTGLK